MIKQSANRPCKQKGFTLVELLIAVTAGVIVVGVALGIYRDTAGSETLLRGHYEKSFLRSRLTSLLNSLLIEQTGPVYGNRERLVFLSGMNLLGYGRELVALSVDNVNGQDYLKLYVVPERFAGQGSMVQRAAGLFKESGTNYEYSHRERIKGFGVRFGYEIGDESFNEVTGDDEVTLTIVLLEGDRHEWLVAGPRRG